MARADHRERPALPRLLYQADRYVEGGQPLPLIAPRAVITSPAEGAIVAGPTVVRGYCWSGRAPIARVELTADDGRTWSDATIEPAVSPHAWRRWEVRWEPAGPGDRALLARAWTTDGEGQPLDQIRTSLGHLNNAARPVTVFVGAAT